MSAVFWILQWLFGPLLHQHRRSALHCAAGTARGNGVDV